MTSSALDMGKKSPFIGIQAGRSYPDGTIETHMPPLQFYPQSWGATAYALFLG